MSRHRNFTPDEIALIREEYLTGELVKTLCEKYRVSRTTMSRVIKGLAPKRRHNPMRRIYGKPRILVVANGVEIRLTETQKFFYDTLLNSACIDCGETNLVLLDFDHRDPRQKTESVAQLKVHYDNIELVKMEMAKCDVRCVSCHRKKTAIEHNWKSYHMEQERRNAKNKADQSGH